MNRGDRACAYHDNLWPRVGCGLIMHVAENGGLLEAYADRLGDAGDREFRLSDTEFGENIVKHGRMTALSFAAVLSPNASRESSRVWRGRCPSGAEICAEWVISTAADPGACGRLTPRRRIPVSIGGEPRRKIAGRSILPPVWFFRGGKTR